MENQEKMRINKYLAHNKHSTRKGADELIMKGLVSINGRRAVLGDKVGAGDIVEVQKSKKPTEYVYFAYNKPRGVITHSPQLNEKDIKSSIKMKDVFPIGRLDKDSSGLIILTNDGRITDRLLNPKFDHEKEYLVTTKKPLRPSFKTKMEAGVKIENEMTRKCKVYVMNANTFRIVISEGKKHQIRRMCAALFNEVNTLKRIRVMNVMLNNLQENSLRKIEGVELETFLKSLGI